MKRGDYNFIATGYISELKPDEMFKIVVQPIAFKEEHTHTSWYSTGRSRSPSLFESRFESSRNSIEQSSLCPSVDFIFNLFCSDALFNLLRFMRYKTRNSFVGTYFYILHSTFIFIFIFYHVDQAYRVT